MQDGNNGVAFVEQGGEAGGTAYFVYATKDAGKTWTKCTNYIKLSSTFTNVFAVDNKIILIDFNYNYDEPFRVSEFTVNPDGSYSDVLIDSQKKIVPLQPSPIREQIPFKLPFRMERRPLTPFPIQ